MKFGIITSSPFLISITFKATSSAAEPLEIEEQYLCPIRVLNLFSNTFTSGPADEIQFFFRALIKIFLSEVNNLNLLTGIILFLHSYLQYY